MESNINSQKGKKDNEVSTNKSSKDRNVLGENGVDDSKLEPKKLVSKPNPDRALILNVKQLKSCTKDSFFQSISVLDGTIPKNMVTVDEKYIRRCLELIQISALNVSTHEIRSERAWELRKFFFDSPSPAGNGSVIISPAEHWIDGSIMGSKSMVNILNSPLFRKLGVVEDDAHCKGTVLDDVKGYSFMNFPNALSYSSPQMHVQETPIIQNAALDRFVSVSSTNSTSSDQSSSTSASVAITRGVLQCIWKGEVPQFIFNVDDQKESYVANLRKTDLPDDFVYLFHSRKDGSKIHHMESHLVGKMKISTTFTLGQDNSKIMEREFVLFGGNDKFVGETSHSSSSHNSKKNKGISKVVKALKINQRTVKFRKLSATLENYSPDDSGVSRINLLDNDLPPNLELAAVLVKERLPDNHEEKVGGWGLNFLKKQTAQKSSTSSACDVLNNVDCSSSIDVLVPAGLHGGPISINGGPSSLFERWRSEGHCDCGGWDLGCPLTVLKAKQETFPQPDMEECCKFIDLFIKGSEHGTPTLRMVNMRDGLYFIHFQSTLSALQSFSIAVAYIHSQSPTLRPKNIEEVN